jgi:hypothetical protein
VPLGSIGVEILRFLTLRLFIALLKIAMSIKTNFLETGLEIMGSAAV